jgi:putative two-component system response regulator
MQQQGAQGTDIQRWTGFKGGKMGSTHNDRIGTLLRSRGSGPPVDLKGELSRLCASLKERLATGSAASYDYFHSAVCALSKLKGSLHSELRMECYLQCVNFFYANGFSKSALESARSLDALAASSGNDSWNRKAKTALGAILGDAGDAVAGVICHQRALTIARQIGDRAGEILVLNNLGGALWYGGLTDEAASSYRLSARLARLEGMEIAEADALANIAQLCLYNEDYEKGMEAIVESLAAVGEPSNALSALNRTIREFVYVQLALGLGQIEVARSHLQECRRFSRWSDSHRSEFLASVAGGLCEIHSGDVAAGIAQLEAALASTDQENHFRGTCLTALVRGCDEAMQPEKALRYMQQLVEYETAKRSQSVQTLMASSPETWSRVSRTGSRRQQALERRQLKLRAEIAEREMSSFRVEMFERLAVAANLKEESSGEHGYRVGKLAFLLAEDLKWHPEASVSLEFAARLHDIGKIGVPDRILLTSQELKDAERHFVGMHTVIGAELLAKSNVPQLRMAEEVARYHHEWWDGTGYPSKLAGRRIPIHARIVALADVFDALTHGRPYSAPWSNDRAIDEIRSRCGTQFDPELTDRFLDLVMRLRQEHEDLDAFLAKAAVNSPFAQARAKIRHMLAQEHENERHAEAIAGRTVH